jgi:hypothetical protein
MMNLNSRGLPMRPDQNPLAQRRQMMNAGNQPPPMQRQMMQAAALRGDTGGMQPPMQAQQPMQPMQQAFPDPMQVQQQQRMQAGSMVPTGQLLGRRF